MLPTCDEANILLKTLVLGHLKVVVLCPQTFSAHHCLCHRLTMRAQSQLLRNVKRLCQPDLCLTPHQRLWQTGSHLTCWSLGCKQQRAQQQASNCLRYTSYATGCIQATGVQSGRHIAQDLHVRASGRHCWLSILGSKLLFFSQAGKEGPIPAAHLKRDKPFSTPLDTPSPSKALEDGQSADALNFKVQLLLQRFTCLDASPC